MQAGSSGNARDESGRTAKNQSPRHNYLVGRAWLGCLAAWRALGRYEAVFTLCILYYGRVMRNGMVCYCLSSCLPSCQVPSTLSSALYDLPRINANGGVTGRLTAKPSPSYRLTSPSQPG